MSTYRGPVSRAKNFCGAPEERSRSCKRRPRKVGFPRSRLKVPILICHYFRKFNSEESETRILLGPRDPG